MAEKEYFIKENKNYFKYCDGTLKKIERYKVPLTIANKLDKDQVQKLKKPRKRSRLKINYRSIVEKNIGRTLLKTEIIHHLDCNRTNNSIKNLFLTNKSEHKKLHFQLEFLARYLIKEKIILFDLKERSYHFNEKVKFSFLE